MSSHYVLTSCIHSTSCS